jgi:hypothetical protein
MTWRAVTTADASFLEEAIAGEGSSSRGSGGVSGRCVASEDMAGGMLKGSMDVYTMILSCFFFGGCLTELPGGERGGQGGQLDIKPFQLKGHVPVQAFQGRGGRGTRLTVREDVEGEGGMEQIRRLRKITGGIVSR